MALVPHWRLWYDAQPGPGPLIGTQLACGLASVLTLGGVVTALCRPSAAVTREIRHD
jgi:hypothetical protein